MMLNRSLIVVAILLAAMLVGGTADAASKPRVILAPLTDNSTPDYGTIKVEGITETLRNALQEALFKSGKFTLVADADLARDLDAERYNQYLSGDFNPAQAAAIGQKVGAQALVKCAVVKNQIAAKTKDMILWRETEYTMTLHVSAQICDIEKGVICFMHTAATEQKTKSKELPMGENQPPISLRNPSDPRGVAINAVVKELAEKIIQNAGKEKGKASVTKVSGAGRQGDSVIIDLGSNSGAEQDLSVTISTVDEDGFEEEIGSARIVAVQEDKSKAEITQAKKPVKVGDVVVIARAAGGMTAGGSTGSPGGSVTEVVAQGQGTSRDAAVNDALTQAIQQAAGVYILSEQEARNYEMVKNELFSQTRGFIAKYEPVGDAATDSGITTVKVRAWVSNRPVYDALLAKKVLARQRVMVVVPETHMRLIVPDPAGETEIVKRLVQRNFLVVDQKLSKEIANNETLRAQLKGDADKVLALVANKSNAEILIYGEAFSEGAQRVNTPAGPKWTCGARVEVRAVLTDTAEILAADGAQATATDATESLAGKRALKVAAELLCNGKEGQPGFVDAVSEKLMDTTRYVQCVVSNVSDLNALNDVEEALRDAIGNRPLHRYSYADGIARLNLVTNRTAQDLTGIIAKQPMKGKLKLVGNTVNKIEYEYSK